jgi:hypothetical protein
MNTTIQPGQLAAIKKFGLPALVVVLVLAGLYLFLDKIIPKTTAIDGTYASYESGDYSISKDTLVIIPYGDQGDYQVIRKSSFQAVRNGKLQPTAQQIREYMGRLDPKSGMLIIEAQGKKISFLPDQNSLLLMQREYHKVVKQ